MKGIVEEIQDTLEQANSLKGSAKTNRDFEDYNDALRDLDRAIGLLRSTLARLETMDPGEVEQHEALRAKLAAELADCYGMKGGNHRRQGNLEAAEQMYTTGAKYEQAYRIPDTYNRTNVIVLRLLRAPGDREAVADMLRDSRREIEDQVRGKNKNKWWAWADYGLLNLLSAAGERAEDRARYEDEAHAAYEQFRKNGAGRQHFESTIVVLDQLRQSLAKVDGTAAALIQKETDYLNDNMPDQ